MSIMGCFLIESDQEILAFLDALELQILFTMLVGVFSASAVLVFDLSEVFLGQYRVTPTVAQLTVIRDTLPSGTGDSVPVAIKTTATSKYLTLPSVPPPRPPSSTLRT